MSAVHLTIDGGMAELRLDNPAKLNAFTGPMLDQLAAHLETIERSDARVVLLTAEEAKCFCSGADILAWGALSPAEFARYWVRGGHRIFDRLARLAQPTIAVLHAHAFGGGLELAAACDIRVMAPRATIALPEPVVKEMALFGRRIGADRALALGFAAEISDTPREAARAIAAKVLDLSPRAVEIAKSMIHAAAGEDHAAMVEALGSAAISASDDRNEGVTAFADKRKPLFSGK